MGSFAHSIDRPQRQRLFGSSAVRQARPRQLDSLVDRQLSDTVKLQRRRPHFLFSTDRRQKLSPPLWHHVLLTD
jgi:hypothetical protein